jgi:dihydroflavonol-4-reductase
MNIVTGSTGLVGSNLIRALLHEKKGVRAIVHRDTRGVDGLPVEKLQAELGDIPSLIKAFARADVVYHLAAIISLQMSNWRECVEVNVLGTRNVVEACLRSGVKRLVYFSSIHALVQEPFSIPVDENRPRVQSNRYPPYDRTKALAEKEVRKGIAKGLDAVIVNPTAVIGPFDFKPSNQGQALIALARGRLPALVNGGFDWVDARDVAQGAILAAQQGKCGESYLLPGDWYSVREVATLICNLSGRRPPALTVPTWLAYQSAPILSLLTRLSGNDPIFTKVSLRALHSNRHIDHSKAEMELGYHHRPLRETIAETYRWFSDNGYL